MPDSQLPFCPFCKNTKNKEVVLTEKHDLLTCTECNSVLMLSSKSPLPRYQNDWRTTSESIYPLIRPFLSQDEFANARLFFLYEDCFHCLLIGRPNAAIICMGVLLEALMKEVIRLKNNDYGPTSYGSCLSIIENDGLMRAEDVIFLKNFKDKVRDLYQHSKESKILKGRYISVWPIEFKESFTIEMLNKAYEGIRSGQLKPTQVPAGAFPALRSIAKQQYDKNVSVDLFNEIHDFVQVAIITYFKQEYYDEHHKKFGNRLQDLPHHIIE